MRKQTESESKKFNESKKRTELGIANFVSGSANCYSANLFLNLLNANPLIFKIRQSANP
jgi:hypothetical protein